MNYYLFIYLFIGISVVYGSHNHIYPLVVETNTGTVRGYYNLTSDTRHFLGIPYAKPPIGSLRFKSPEDVTPWTGILDATNYGYDCYQTSPLVVGELTTTFNVSEDCLTLNIYTPKQRYGRGKLPVAVLLHGGGYTSSSARKSFPNTNNIIDKSIYVTVNSRLGWAGYSRLPEDPNGSNFAGIMDQQKALQWVYDNIDKFGGDRKQITLGGQSVGATSTKIHMLLPGSKNLFDSAIMMSAVPQLPTTTTMATKTGALMQLSGCTTTACMQSKPASLLQAIQFQLGPFYPSVGSDSLLSKQLINLFRDLSPNSLNVKRFLIGTVKREADLYLYPLGGLPSNPAFGVSNYLQATTLGLSFLFWLPQAVPGVTNLNVTQNHYLQVAASSSYWEAASDAIADGATNCHSGLFSQEFARHGIVYRYIYEHTPKYSNLPFNVTKTGTTKNAALHGSELVYLQDIQGPTIYTTNLSNSEEDILVPNMQSWWNKFVTNGRPGKDAESGDNAEDCHKDEQWPRYKGPDYKVKSIDINTDVLEHVTNSDICKSYWEPILLA